MEIKAVQKATILSQALPYIQKYNGKIVVIKYGGNAMKNETLKQNVMSDVAVSYTHLDVYKRQVY